MVVPCAQLRVFVPVDSLAPAEREQWATGRGALGHTEARAMEDEVARLRLLRRADAPPTGAVLVRRTPSGQYVCPLQYDVRAAAALRTLADEVPQSVVDMLLPTGPLRTRLEQTTAAGLTPTIIDAPWAVPLAWFVLFEESERRLLDPPGASGPRLLHLTQVSQAIARLGRAIEAMDLVEDVEDVREELAGLAGWLEAFDRDSLLELDYAGVTRLLSRDQLEADHSAHDVWSAVRGLESGDLLAAVAYYGAVRGRWSRLRSRATAS